MKYLHLNVKGYKAGYYEEKLAWDIVGKVPQSDVKFLAGGLSLEDVQELRKQCKALGCKVLPIIEEVKSNG